MVKSHKLRAQKGGEDSEKSLDKKKREPILSRTVGMLLWHKRKEVRERHAYDESSKAPPVVRRPVVGAGGRAA